MAEANERISVDYAMTGDPAFDGHCRRIDRHFIRDRVPDYADRVWYVAGPPGFVASVNHLLRTELRLRNIKLEVFTGY